MSIACVKLKTRFGFGSG